MDAFVDVAQSQDELARIFVQLGLAKEGEMPVATPLTGGVSSGIFRVDTGSGSYCLKQALPRLKVEKEWKVPVDRVFAEIGWLKTAGAIVPTPGGLGTIEVAFIGGLTAVGINPGIAASVTILFRVLTYWLPIPIGWLALRRLQATGEL